MKQVPKLSVSGFIYFEKERNVSFSLLNKASEFYKINKNNVLSGEGEMFIKDSDFTESESKGSNILQHLIESNRILIDSNSKLSEATIKLVDNNTKVIDMLSREKGK